MNVLSLFDGISCGKVALERSGIKVDNYFSSEIDENAIAISQKNHPDIIRLGDVTNWKEWNLPQIDLVIGGSPCQGFSRNGAMLNFEDPRSKLFFTFHEILEDIKAKNPNVLFLLENVEMKTEWRDLISEYMGVNGVLINSALLSAQNRPRIYWSNIPFEIPEDKNIKLAEILDDVDESNYIEIFGIKFDSTYNSKEIALVNRSDGEIRISQATRQGYIVAEAGDGVNLQFPTSKTRRGRVTKQKSATLDCQCNIGVLKDNTIRHLKINELERLQTLPEGYTKGFDERIAKKAIGNGWTVDVISHIFNFIKED